MQRSAVASGRRRARGEGQRARVQATRALVQQVAEIDSGRLGERDGQQHWRADCRIRARDACTPSARHESSAGWNLVAQINVRSPVGRPGDGSRPIRDWPGYRRLARDHHHRRECNREHRASVSPLLRKTTLSVPVLVDGTSSSAVRPHSRGGDLVECRLRGAEGSARKQVALRFVCSDGED